MTEVAQDKENSLSKSKRFEAEKARFVSFITSKDNVGLILRIHLSFERLLEQFIVLKLPYPNKINIESNAHGNNSFSYKTKLRLALALGLGDGFEFPLIKVNDLRNNLAHNIDLASTDIICDDNFALNFYNCFTKEHKKYIIEWRSDFHKTDKDERIKICILMLHALLNMEVDKAQKSTE